MCKRYLIGLLFLLVAACVLVVFFTSSQEERIGYSVSDTSDGYREYAFDSGKDLDMGFTRRVLEHIQASEDMLINGAVVIDSGEMKYVRPTEEDKKRGTIEKRSVGTEIYELRSDNGKTIGSTYSVFKNDEFLFSAPMDFGSDGPILDWRIVDGKPAITYRTSCDQKCNTEIFFGGLISERLGVTNPRNLFVYNGKVGFVIEDGGADKIYYDENFITPGFESIHTHNCCALNEILPTVYDNGVILFHGKRGDQYYLVEATLI
ncbi:MAG: hypothetical protein NUV54_01455 [Candidatus Taylorbacteria bacterium]|nr:hypothetical protein [Candidatus Taylorbacteria bacterium]